MEIITPLQKEILKIFPEIEDSNAFYLTGGTALAAFYLTHRKSNDLDFFTGEENILTPFSFRLEKKLRDQARLLLQVHDELVFEIQEAVAENLIPEMREIMERVWAGKVKMEAEAKVGRTWADL